MKTNSSGSTAADLVRALSNDPEFLKKQELRERERLNKAKKLLEAGAPLNQALKNVGFPVESVWDLVNSKNNYSAAIYVLIEHLNIAYPKEILEGIARALATPFAIPVRLDLIQFLKSNRNIFENVSYAVCLAISATTTKDNLQETIDLVEDYSLGSCRLGLLPALKRNRKSVLVKNALIRLSSDPELIAEITSWK